jgi:hypothetical protein
MRLWQVISEADPAKAANGIQNATSGHLSQTVISFASSQATLLGRVCLVRCFRILIIPIITVLA